MINFITISLHTPKEHVMIPYMSLSEVLVYTKRTVKVIPFYIKQSNILALLNR